MSHIMREVYENCDLHTALMNTGYVIERKDYSINGKYTGKKVDFYRPAYEPMDTNVMSTTFTTFSDSGSALYQTTSPIYVQGADGKDYPYITEDNIRLLGTVRYA